MQDVNFDPLYDEPYSQEDTKIFLFLRDFRIYKVDENNLYHLFGIYFFREMMQDKDGRLFFEMLKFFEIR